MKKQSITLIMIFLSLLMNACTDNKSIREADLEGYTWVLTDLSGGLLLEGHQPTLKFDGGQISGDAECDHYGGSYHLGGDTIRVEGLFNTEMACPEPEGIMAQEQIYLDMLRTAERFERIDSTLTIFLAAGQKLVFTNQPDVVSTPVPALEPATASQTPEIITPVPTLTKEPTVGFKEYQDPIARISLSIPESWEVTGVLPGQSAIFQSYPVDKYVGGEKLGNSDIKCDLRIHPEGTSAVELISSWRSDPMTTILAEDEFRLQNGSLGQRFIVDNMGRAMVFLVGINQRIVSLICFGDFTQADKIAITLKTLK